MDNDGVISKDELDAVLKAANLSLPGYRVREMIQELSMSSEVLNFDKFAEVSQLSNKHSAFVTHFLPAAKTVFAVPIFRSSMD